MKSLAFLQKLSIRVPLIPATLRYLSKENEGTFPDKDLDINIH